MSNEVTITKPKLLVIMLLVLILLCCLVLVAAGITWYFATQEDVNTPTPSATNGTIPTLTPELSVVIHDFSALPAQIQSGECVNLIWKTLGAAQIKLIRKGEIILEIDHAEGVFQDCPIESGTTSYRLEATNPSGYMAWQERTVVVAPEPSITPPPSTATSESEGGDASITIADFAVVPGEIKTGSCVNITWSVLGAAESIMVIRNGTILGENLPLDGALDDCPQANGTFVYTLEAENSFGWKAYEERIVTVTE